MKRNTPKKPRRTPEEGYEPQEFGGITMHPFQYNAAGFARALELAEAVSTHEQDDTCIAIALLVTGIAAIGPDDERAAFAYFVTQRVLSKSERITRAMNKYIADYQGEGGLSTYMKPTKRTDKRPRLLHRFCHRERSQHPKRRARS